MDLKIGQIRKTAAAAIAVIPALGLAALAHDQIGPADGVGAAWCVDLDEDAEECAFLIRDLIVFIDISEDSYGVVQIFNDGEGVRPDLGHPYGQPGRPPVLRDLDEDGLPEIIIPVEGYAANSDYDIWAAQDRVYARAGQVTTSWTVEGWDLRDGLIVTGQRGFQRAYIETAWQLTSHGMTSVYEMTTDYANEPGAYCALSAPSGLSAYALDAATLLAECETAAAAALD